VARTAADLIRRVYELYSAGDVDALEEFWADDALFDLTHLDGWPDEQLIEGGRAVVEFMREWRASFPEYFAEIEELVEVDPGRVVLFPRQGGRPGPDTVFAEMRWAQIVDAEDGVITRCENWSDRDAARRAAGLRVQSAGEIVKRAFANYNRGQYFQGISWARDGVWDMSRFDGWIGEPLLEGTEAIREWIREWVSGYAEVRAEIEELHELGPDRVFVLVKQAGRPAAGKNWVELRWAMVLELRDGLIVRAENWSDRDDALRAVGLA
jgi:ketosteroid isomerase-like protein